MISLTGKYDAIDYSQVNDPKEFLTLLDQGIAVAQQRFTEIKADLATPDFQNTIEVLEFATQELELASNAFHALYHAHATDEISAIAQDFSLRLTRFSSDFSLDEKLFERVKTVYDAGLEQYSVEEKKLLENTYDSFVRNGALLNDEDKKKLRQIDEQLSQYSVTFSQNALKATNAFDMLLESEDDLEGLPETARHEAAERAQAKDKKGWLFDLSAPSVTAFLKDSKKRELREKLVRAYGCRALGGEFDNSGLVKDLVRLRHERAQLLGFEGHADFVLRKRMAGNLATVTAFLSELKEKSYTPAKREFEQLKQMAKDDGISDYSPWDGSYYAERLKEKELQFDSEQLRSYFELNKTLEGMLSLAAQLYDIRFTKVNDVPTYHPEITVYELKETNGSFLGLLFFDLFPRATKRNGAWMMDIKSGGLAFGKQQRPHVGIVCNFSKPLENRPSLLRLEEVETLFHEFGHALHCLLSKCEYRSLFGTNVYWDFVELPSQFMENWVFEEEVLNTFAEHYETKEKIPHELIEKVKKDKKFLAGIASLRQLSFGALDMAWHGKMPDLSPSVEEFENAIMKDYSFLPPLKGVAMSTAFTHLFGGGYSAGYYSYKWAEVLDADAFEFFKETGIFNKETARKFKENILEKGGSQHPMDLYLAFRGRKPQVEPLLKRSGLL